MNSTPLSKHRRRAFTLIELVVVVGIIALLIGIAVPMLMVTYRKAGKTKAAADMAALKTALDAYRTDFGDYPRFEAPGTGFAILGKALLAPGPGGGPLPALGAAPYPAGTYTSVGVPGSLGYGEFVCFGRPDPQGGFASPNPQTDGTTWASFYVSDGKDGPGFRGRAGGKTYGPYIQPEKFRVRGLAILDAWDNPILYFPARPGRISTNTAAGPWALLTGGSSVYPAGGNNLSFFLRPNETIAADEQTARKRMDAFMVEGSDFDGVVEGAEKAITTEPYILWSAGADGSFGVTYDVAGNPTKKDIEKCDDVTSFR